MVLSILSGEYLLGSLCFNQGTIPSPVLVKLRPNKTGEKF